MSADLLLCDEDEFGPWHDVGLQMAACCTLARATFRTKHCSSTSSPSVTMTSVPTNLLLDPPADKWTTLTNTLSRLARCTPDTTTPYGRNPCSALFRDPSSDSINQYPVLRNRPLSVLSAHATHPARTGKLEHQKGGQA